MRRGPRATAHIQFRSKQITGTSEDASTSVSYGKMRGPKVRATLEIGEADSLKCKE